MNAGIVHPYEWTTSDTQYFLAFNKGSESLNIFKSPLTDSYSCKKITEVPFFFLKDIQCFDYWSSEKGCVAVGSLSGDIRVSNLLTDKKPILIQSNPKDRSCNTVSFSRTGLLAAGYERVRSSCSLKIYDIRRLSKSHAVEIYSTVPGEPTRSVSFVKNEPHSLIGGVFKHLKGFDTRVNAPVFSFATTHLLEITTDPLNSNYFSSHNDKGNIRIWDRRYLIPNGSSSDYSLSISPFGKDIGICPFQMSNNVSGEFSSLNPTGNEIKRWKIGQVPEITRSKATFVSKVQHQNIISTTESSGNDSQIKINSHLFVSSIIITKIPNSELGTNNDNPVVSFDYVPNMKNPKQVEFVCLYSNNQLCRFKTIEIPSAVKFDSSTNVAISNFDHITFHGPRKNTRPQSLADECSVSAKRNNKSLSPTTPQLMRILILDDESKEENEHDVSNSCTNTKSEINSTLSNRSNTSLHTLEYILERDVSATMQSLAINGYSMDCDKNIQLLRLQTLHFSQSDKLVSAWEWIRYVKNDRSRQIFGSVDFSFEGVLGIWLGYNWIFKKSKNSSFTQDDFDMAVSQILKSLGLGQKKRIYTKVLRSDQSKRNLRQLCLRAAGWDFDESQLESKLQELESQGLFEKAAGWAVFHGNVNRAVEALAKSQMPKHRMISAAIAGYDGYRRTKINTPWKDLCRNMGSSLENPYLRTIFGFIADGDWSEVLEQSTLPLNELLGIALRFYQDDELSTYLKRLTSNVVKNGDLDGIILTGLTPMALDLFQSYVNKTADVQTASLVISFAYPLYFQDERPMYWIECYKSLLNSWRLFAKRSMFDISRARASKLPESPITLNNLPRQVYLSCHNCKGVIGNDTVSFNTSTSLNDQKNKGTPIKCVMSSVDNISSNRHLKSVPFQSSPRLMASCFKETNHLANSNIKCPHCNYPLPKCAVCLLPLGAVFPRIGINTLASFQNLSIGTNTRHDPKMTKGHNQDPHEQERNAGVGIKTTHPDGENNSDRYFIFCLSCSHGMHACHAKEWFLKHQVCAVPDCNCICTKY